MANLYLVLWAVIPPLLFLWFYYRRTPAAPPGLNLLVLFIIGAISGFAALGFEAARGGVSFSGIGSGFIFDRDPNRASSVACFILR